MAIDPEIKAGARVTDAMLSEYALRGRIVAWFQRFNPQDIPDRTMTPIAWDDPIIDLVGIGTGPAISPSLPGMYMLKGGVGFQSSTAGTQRLSVWRQDGNNITGSVSRPSVGPYDATGSSARVSFPARPIVINHRGQGSVIELCAWQDTGSTLPTSANDGEIPNLIIKYVGPFREGSIDI